jgi:hypothetical protein
MPHIRFESQVVPEPAALALLGAGLLTAVARRGRSARR